MSEREPESTYAMSGDLCDEPLVNHDFLAEVFRFISGEPDEYYCNWNGRTWRMVDVGPATPD